MGPCRGFHHVRATNIRIGNGATTSRSGEQERERDWTGVASVVYATTSAALVLALPYENVAARLASPTPNGRRKRVTRYPAPRTTSCSLVTSTGLPGLPGIPKPNKKPSSRSSSCEPLSGHAPSWKWAVTHFYALGAQSSCGSSGVWARYQVHAVRRAAKPSGADKEEEELRSG